MQASSTHCRAGGKVAIVVTGASRGFGQALCQELARRFVGGGFGGLDFVLVARTEAGLVKTEEAIRKVTGKVEVKVHLLPLDLGDLDRVPESFKGALAKLDGDYERVVLCNNHGTLAMSRVKGHETPEGIKAVRRAIDTNVTSTFIITPIFLDRFSSNRRVTVVNTSSLLAQVPCVDLSLYCAGKAARDLYHAVLAQEQKDVGVRTLNYAPGRMDTEMATDILAKSTSESLQTLFAAEKKEQKLFNPATSARKLADLVVEDTFESGSHVDAYDFFKGLIFGIDNPLLDISAQVPFDLLTKYGLQPSNAILAGPEHLPLYEELEKNYQVEYIAGGAGQNAVRAAQWMLRVPGATRYVGCVGKDHHGALLKKAAEADGLETHYLEDPTTPTGTCAVLVTQKDRSLVANLAAANCYKKEHLEQNFHLVEEAKFIYVTGFFLTVSPECLVMLGQHAAAKNKPFLMNLAAPFLIDFFYDGKMENVLPYVDVLFGNEHEAAAFGKRFGWGDDLEVIAAKVAALPKANDKRKRMVVFTQGPREVIVHEDGQLTKYPTPLVPQEEIVDLNGAGDCFVGGFLSAYVQYLSTAKCIEAGHYCAGVCIRTSGIKFEGKYPDFSFCP